MAGVDRIKTMDFTIHPLTPKNLHALEDLFNTQGPVSRCWCMYWRIGDAYRKRPPKKNKTEFSQLVKNGPPLGLLAFSGDLCVGWCQLTPRASLPWMEKTWRLKRVDDLPVWSLSCFYIRKGWRKKGVTSALIAEALNVARKSGAPALEAYPLDAKLSPSSTSTGYVSTFKRFGFKVVAHHVPPRPIMRYDFK